MWHERAAVRVARPHRAAEVIQSVAEALVAQVRDVEDDAEALHLAQQLMAARPHPAARIRPLRVDPRTVVRGADGAQAVRVRAFQMVQRHERVGTFQTENVANRCSSA